MGKVRKLVCGVGINDADYVVKTMEEWREDGKRKSRCIWRCHYYDRWLARIITCYDKPRQVTQPAYRGCTVSREWLTFSNFREWMVNEEVKLGDLSQLHLDKDLLSEKGNKVYSKDTCVFIPRKVNNFSKDTYAYQGKWPLGVSFSKCANKFAAECNNPLSPITGKGKHIGLFTCPLDAHYAWQERKHEYAIMLANSVLVTDERVKHRLLTMYAPDTDWLNGWTHPDE